LAFAGGRGQLNAEGIEEAWADLQQLPTPWNEGSADSQRAGPKKDDLIEFGDLDDENETAGDELLESPAVAGQRPTVLLREIEDHLTALEDDLMPLGAVGSDAPRLTARPANPFHEPFEEEELLVDRYASYEMGEFGRHDHVCCQEGQVLSALLEPHLRQTAAPQLSLVGVGPSEAAGRPTRSASGPKSTADHLLAAHSVDAIPAPCDFAWNTATSEHLPLRSAPSPSSVAPPTGPPQDAHRDQPQPSKPDDDLMIVEEDPGPETAAARIRGISPARRQEYRQLFSMLRKG
jgi:hypothetical protein